MSEEEKKERYQKIINRLRTISSQIYQLTDDSYQLEKYISNNLVVNDNGYKVDTLKNQRSTLSSARSTINNTIIPSLKRKL